jgi:hypothetical protein
MAIKNTTILRQASQSVSNLSVLSLGILGFLLMFYASLLFAEPLSNEPVSSANQQMKNNDKILTDVTSVQAKSAQTWSVQQETEAQVLYAEQWELARSGDSVLSLPVLSQVINTWLPDNADYNVGNTANAKKIEIQYPGGEEGELWVQQLTDWLVSLGIPSASIVLTPGSSANDIIKFDIIK